MVRLNSNKNKDDNKSYFFKSIVIILLVIIIILLLLNSCGALGISNPDKLTGDFDIFEITLKGTCECPVCEECKTCSNSSGNGSGGSSSGGNSSGGSSSTGDYEPNTDEEKVIVYDKDQEWPSEESGQSYVANIFRHSSTEIISGKIAPGSTNTYKFIVRNLNEFSVKYTIDFIETNTKNINMKYRLKYGNSYVVGSESQWVSEDALNRSFKSLSAKSMDTYYLEWKWFDDDSNDTAIGIDESSVYSLYIKVEAEEE